MRYIKITLLLFVFSACKEKETADIPVDQMQMILQDIHIAEVYSSMVADTAHRVAEKQMDSLKLYYNDILKHHNVTADQFRNSVAWYKDNPTELDTIYGRMINNLTAMDAAFPKQQ